VHLFTGENCENTSIGNLRTKGDFLETLLKDASGMIILKRNIQSWFMTRWQSCVSVGVGVV
jgi:hypothetical protein